MATGSKQQATGRQAAKEKGERAKGRKGEGKMATYNRQASREEKGRKGASKEHFLVPCPLFSCSFCNPANPDSDKRHADDAD
jgi:hypothetical protein